MQWIIVQIGSPHIMALSDTPHIFIMYYLFHFTFQSTWNKPADTRQNMHGLGKAQEMFGGTQLCRMDNSIPVQIPFPQSPVYPSDKSDSHSSGNGYKATPVNQNIYDLWFKEVTPWLFNLKLNKTVYSLYIPHIYKSLYLSELNNGSCPHRRSWMKL